MNRIIRKVAVLGSGVMGSRIAAHFANAGCQVYLLDIVPKEVNDAEKQKGLSLKDKAVRNRIANENLQNTLKGKPAAFYHPDFASQITTGNFDDNLEWISECDWTIEVVVENLEIKRQLFERVEKFRKPGSLITSNTSGISINEMAKGRSEDFRKHFCGTHFFNPPRYLQLLEIIPAEDTDPEVVEFLMDYGDRFLGKTTVHGKDTPAFIANRIGVFSIMTTLHLMQEMDMTIEQVDALTGPISGRPKSATFRTTDVVGIDTLVKVAENTFTATPDDEKRELFKVPEFVNEMVEKGWTGEKGGQGFYKKTKDKQGKTNILALDLGSLEYRAQQKTKYATVETARPIENLQERLRALHSGNDKAAEFLRKLSFGIFAYSSNRIPEISEAVYKIDDALRAGFGWKLGPFETWDVLGLEKVLAQMKETGHKPANWVQEMVDAGVDSFYKAENGKRKFYDIAEKKYKDIPGRQDIILLDNFRAQQAVWKNEGATLHDVGEGILCLEFHTKLNTLGSEVLQGIQKAVEIAEKDFRGLVIGNEAEHFSAGANLGMIFMLAVEQEFDELDFAVRTFQKTMMSLRYCGIPVVAAPHGMALGGGCELSLHADRIVASAETYMGLVEVGVGLIPAGGGTKEMVKRASENYQKGEVEFPELQHRFLTIAQAKVSTSAHEAIELKFLKMDHDQITVNPGRVITNARKAAIELAEAGYTPPLREANIKVHGREFLGALLTGANAFFTANYISAHDKKIAEKLAYVMCGGDLTAETMVTEQYLLDLEREAFLSLLGEKKTLERIEHMLKTGKPLRN